VVVAMEVTTEEVVSRASPGHLLHPVGTTGAGEGGEGGEGLPYVGEEGMAVDTITM